MDLKLKRNIFTDNSMKYCSEIYGIWKFCCRKPLAASKIPRENKMHRNSLAGMTAVLSSSLHISAS